MFIAGKYFRVWTGRFCAALHGGPSCPSTHSAFLAPLTRAAIHWHVDWRSGTQSKWLIFWISIVFFSFVFFLTGQLKHSFINRTTNKHSSGTLVNLGPNEVIWNALSSLPLWSVPACKSHELMLNVPRRYKMCSRFNAMNADEFTQVLMEKRFDTNENRETLELNSDQQHTTFVFVFFWFLSSQ